jgi:Flp pilus assembly protein TadB
MSPQVAAATRSLRRYATLAAGWTLLVVGVALLVLPGPGVPLIIAGLAVLGREVEWARRLRTRIEERFARFRRRGQRAPVPGVPLTARKVTE